MALTLKINGQEWQTDAAPDTPLLWVVRDHLGMTGSKFGCGIALCGACTMEIDGVAQRTCVLPVSAVVDREIRTIEGAAASDDPVEQAVVEAWDETQVAQCGYCQSGQIMSAISLLKSIPTPSDEQIDQAMAGNICRCATYPQIRTAIHNAAKAIA
ncbi:(2Fe-2S)-binding protein [Gammaproteobacteria bacterium]|nr:(2Fe-2S)-binding protein [Gammaproteobacteria bacterium]